MWSTWAAGMRLPLALAIGTPVVLRDGKEGLAFGLPLGSVATGGSAGAVSYQSRLAFFVRRPKLGLCPVMGSSRASAFATDH